TVDSKHVQYNDSSGSKETLTYNLALRENDQVHLSWDVNFSEEKVVFRIQRRHPHAVGWFAFGMSDDGTTRDADLLFWWQEEDGHFEAKCNSSTLLLFILNHNKLFFQDAWTDDDSIVHIDVRQSYKIVDYTKRPEIESITFERIFDTCDKRDYVIEGGTVDIINFSGDEQITSPDGLNISEFNNNMKRVQLLKSQMQVPPLPDDVIEINYLAPEVHVPDNVTTYWCSTHKVPKLPNKNHIIRFESVITPGNEDIVHHMEVFLCESDISEEYNAECKSETKPKAIESCKHVLGAWAMGAEPFIYPAEAGVEFGGPEFPRHVVLEIHYNNPLQRSGAVDKSGMRFYYTPTLRPHDAGIMELGLTYSPRMSIPPNNEGFILNGYCTPECTEQALPATGIKVFGSQLHTHLTGTAVWTKHVRNGNQLPDLNRDDHFSTHFQDIRLLRQQVSVLPGDMLVTGCKYNTMDRTNVTLGGFGIEDEMCLNYIHYYPRTKLEVCKSTIAKRALNKFFIYMYKNYKMPLIRGGGMKVNYNKVKWSRTTSYILQTVFQTKPIEMMCLENSGSQFPGKWQYVPHPTITLPLHKKDPCRNINDFLEDRFGL
uniref:Dopamine beta-hydroxylase-like n=1 Tax=Saccoglossus kowalevskii TaxID=10224 RepID=A0ABM0MLH0_SACKO